MFVTSMFSTKGGPGKTTLIFLLAAAFKALAPSAKIGIIDATADQGALAGEWAFDLETDPEGLGLWRLIHTFADPLASRQASTTLPAILKKSIRKIRVIPNREEPEAVIELLNTGREMGKDVRDLPKVTATNASENIAAPILEQIADQLGWDYCLIDLPGSIQDSLSRMFLPCCSTVIIPHDLRSELNFHGFPDLMSTMRTLKVPVSGFLVNQKEDSEAYRSCRLILDDFSAEYGVPVVGEVETFKTIRKALQRVREDERIDDRDAEAGLYRMLIAKYLGGAPLNASTRALVRKGIDQIEATAKTIMTACSVEV